MKNNIIIEILKNNRPNLSDGSLKAYESKLRNLFYLFHSKNTPLNIDFFYNQKEILNELININLRSRKTLLAALVVLINNKKDSNLYIEQMEKDMAEDKDVYQHQLKTDKQEDKWISINDINKVYNKLFNKLKYLFDENTIDFKEYLLLQDLMILGIYTQNDGIVRRNKDIYLLKIRNINKDKDNYINFDNKQFIIHDYKTKKKYGKQVVDINDKLFDLINNVIKFNNTNKLIIKDIENKDEVNSDFIKKSLQRYLGVSSSMLRHIYLTDKYKNIDLDDLNKTATNYGHSLNTLLEYIKK
jgi:hypothetical protein